MSLSKWIRAAITLFLICRRCISDEAAERLGYFSDEWEHAPPRRDWDDQCCRPLLFSYRNSIPGSTGGHVAGASAAYENQALQCEYLNRGTSKKIIQPQRFLETKDSQVLCNRWKLKHRWTYLTSQETALKVENVIGPFAKKLENLLFSENVVIG